MTGPRGKPTTGGPFYVPTLCEVETTQGRQAHLRQGFGGQAFNKTRQHKTQLDYSSFTYLMVIG